MYSVPPGTWRLLHTPPTTQPDISIARLRWSLGPAVTVKLLSPVGPVSQNPPVGGACVADSGGTGRMDRPCGNSGFSTPGSRSLMSWVLSQASGSAGALGGTGPGAVAVLEAAGSGCAAVVEPLTQIAAVAPAATISPDPAAP